MLSLLDCCLLSRNIVLSTVTLDLRLTGRVGNAPGEEGRDARLTHDADVEDVEDVEDDGG